MSRLLAVLLAVLVVLVLGEKHLREHQQARHRLEGTLRLLAQVPVERVEQLEIGLGPRSWRYVRHGHAWRYPAYFSAFARQDRLDQLLGSLLQTPCTPVSAEPGELDHYGLVPGGLRLALMDRAGTLLLEVRLGRGAPGPGAGECYVQRVGADTVYHLHAHPAQALERADPPLLDRRVLPGALSRKALSKISFAGHAAYPIRSLRRQLRMLAPPALPGAPPQGPGYEWLAVLAQGEKSCAGSSASAYVDFLSRLSWTALRDPRTPGLRFERALYLEDEEGRVDTLEIGSQDQEGHTLVRLRTTGQVLALTPQKAGLLFPTLAALLDTLPQPTPYEQAEPYGAQSF